MLCDPVLSPPPRPLPTVPSSFTQAVAYDPELFSQDYGAQYAEYVAERHLMGDVVPEPSVGRTGSPWELEWVGLL